MGDTAEGVNGKSDPEDREIRLGERMANLLGFTHRRQRPSADESGYFANNDKDWPDQVSASNVSLQGLQNVVARFDDVYNHALDDIKPKED